MNGQCTRTSSSIHLQKTNMVWSGSSRYYIPVERWVAVSLCGQQESHLWSYNPATRLRSLSFNLINIEPFPLRSGPLCCQSLHMASTDKCLCGAVQTMNHIAESCPLTRFTDDGDLSRLHSVDDCTVMWLQNVAVKAFTKWNEFKCCQSVMWRHLANGHC